MELSKASCLVWSEKCGEDGKQTTETSELDQKITDYRTKAEFQQERNQSYKN